MEHWLYFWLTHTTVTLMAFNNSHQYSSTYVDVSSWHCAYTWLNLDSYCFNTFYIGVWFLWNAYYFTGILPSFFDHVLNWLFDLTYLYYVNMAVVGGALLRFLLKLHLSTTRLWYPHCHWMYYHHFGFLYSHSFVLLTHCLTTTHIIKKWTLTHLFTGTHC